MTEIGSHSQYLLTLDQAEAQSDEHMPIHGYVGHNAAEAQDGKIEAQIALNDSE